MQPHQLDYSPLRSHRRLSRWFLGSARVLVVLAPFLGVIASIGYRLTERTGFVLLYLGAAGVLALAVAGGPILLVVGRILARREGRDPVEVNGQVMFTLLLFLASFAALILCAAAFT